MLLYILKQLIEFMSLNKKACENVDEITNIIAFNLKVIRKIRGLTLANIAKYLNVSTQQVQKYEAGKSKIDIGTLLILSKYLNIPITFFLEKFDFNKFTDDK